MSNAMWFWIESRVERGTSGECLGAPTLPTFVDLKLQSIQPYLQSRDDPAHHGVP